VDDCRTDWRPTSQLVYSSNGQYYTNDQAHE
jgi:hypothetical protein